jgi:predicted  nucleic acid-binding Zn-ribbon protein
VSDLREKHKSELAEIYDENHSLQLRVEEQRDRDQLRQTRRDLEEFKKRYSDCSLEMNELRKERDSLKLERNDTLIKHAKEVEDERNQRRSLTTEVEKLRFRLKCLEDDL